MREVTRSHNAGRFFSGPLMGPGMQGTYSSAGYMVAMHKRSTFEIARRNKMCGGGYEVVGCFVGSASRRGDPEQKVLNGVSKTFTPYILTGALKMYGGHKLNSGDVFKTQKSGRCLYITGCVTLEAQDYTVRVIGSGYYAEI